MVPGRPGPLWEPPPMFGQITELRFFEKINFLSFVGPKKTFQSPKNLIWPKKPHFFFGGGVIVLKLFDPSNGFEVIDFEIDVFWQNQNWISFGSFGSMTPPKVGFLRPNKVFGALKSFFGPPKPQTNNFLEKPQFCDLTEHWRWFPQWPWSAGCVCSCDKFRSHEGPYDDICYKLEANF